ncbi:MAG: DUF1232 domain-containing protein [Candidatus Eremiobacteraeota bacterium]|nr:DUF1232 domain-containing protein [Candidatus Eremiobacteraeota bacterium]
MRIFRLFNAARKALPRTIPLLRDARVPLFLKIGAAVAALLIVSPLDIFGDIPVLGAIDDAALLTFLCVWFVRFASRHVEPQFAYAGAANSAGAIKPYG